MPVASIPAGDAERHFGFLSGFVGVDDPTSSTITRDLLGWAPIQPGLIPDLGEEHYFAAG